MTNVSPITFTAIFGSNIYGFPSTAATNALLNNCINCASLSIVQINSQNFQVNVVPLSQGLVNLSFVANLASDGLNGNQASSPSSLSVRYASLPPTYVISPGRTPTNQLPVFYVYFDQAVLSFTNTQRNAAILSAFTNAASIVIASVGGNNYTITVTPVGQGLVSLLFPANVPLIRLKHYFYL